MAYDQELADRLRMHLATEPGLTEKPMFGGLAFLIDGNLAISASGQGGLLLRVDPAETDLLASMPHTRRFVMRGREMDGWLCVDVDGTTKPRDLKRWIAVGVRYARTLPPK